MSNLFKKCIIELEDSLTLINDLIPEISIKPENSLLSPLTNDNFNYLESESLINKCDIVCQHYFNDKKPIIRVIHHFACSGGSLISKCIASMPNVYLLSEVHPYTNLHMNSINIKYMPADIASLAKYSDIPQQEKLAKQIFTRSIESTHKHLNEVGGTLVLREHTHADFCSDLDKHEVCAVVDALSDDFKVLSLISLRDPIDSYLSLTRNKWLHFAPQTFDEYCNRLLKFLESYPDSKIILYEDFVSKPKKTMLYICQLLQLQYSELFENLFDSIKVTGDSGRTGKIIGAREREIMTSEFKNEITDSKFYSKFITYIDKRLKLGTERKNYLLLEKDDVLCNENV